MKKVIYTAIFNNYDSVRCPIYVNSDYDYYLFVDETTYEKQHKVIDESIFKTVIIQDVKDGFMKAKDIKVNPEKYLPKIDSSIYVDGSFRQIGDVNKLFKDSISSFQICRHPRRDCIYEESLVCINQRLDEPEIIKLQTERYKSEGFPHNYGLFMGGILARTHNDKCKIINKNWWKEIINGSKRDQLSLNYVLWKLEEKIDVLEYESNGVNQIFKIHPHLKK